MNVAEKMDRKNVAANLTSRRRESSAKMGRKWVGVANEQFSGIKENSV